MILQNRNLLALCNTLGGNLQLSNRGSWGASARQWRLGGTVWLRLPEGRLRQPVEIGSEERLFITPATACLDPATAEFSQTDPKEKDCSGPPTRPTPGRPANPFLLLQVCGRAPPELCPDRGLQSRATPTIVRD